jgi:hypothetical protein
MSDPVAPTALLFKKKKRKAGQGNTRNVRARAEPIVAKKDSDGMDATTTLFHLGSANLISSCFESWLRPCLH